MVTTESSMVNLQDASSPARAIDAADFTAAARTLLGRPLFEPIAPLLEALLAERFGALNALNALLEASDPKPSTRLAHPIRFVRPDASPSPYETRVHDTGEVPTRAGSWHDLFNALVWMRFPRTKAALNALHVDEMRHAKTGAGRGPLRDAATQFDESGIVVLSSDPRLFELLERRCWQELFWVRRADVVSSMRFLVFGHGLYDALRSPFYRICGRAALIPAASSVLDADVSAQCRHADVLLAQRFAARTHYPRPKSLMALPLLGIPGVCPQSECAAYYTDTVQFQPPPATP